MLLNVDIEILNQLAQKPAYGAMGDALWTDPHIAGQMLEAHLDPDTNGASRRLETIKSTTSWLAGRMGMKPGSRLLDLGCGPGLYAEEFSKYGIEVTGVDFSSNSIKYAKNRASEQGLNINYICGNYLDTEYGKEFDAAAIIYYDFGVLFPEDRDNFLTRVHDALKLGGLFAFDVLAPGHRSNPQEKNWDACVGPGFFSPDSHLVFSESYHFPGEQAWMDQHVIWDTNGPRVIRSWDHYYTPAGITAILEARGFCIEEIREDLTGTELREDSKTLAVMARKK